VTAAVVTLREFERVRYDALPADLVRGLERVTSDLGIPLFRFSRTDLQAGRYVGAIQVGGYSVQILPKIYPDDGQNLSYLLFLLGYARRLPLRPTGTAEHEELKGSLLEIWIRHFASELNRLLRRDRRAAYVEIEERGAFLRGKLLVERMTSGQESLSGRYPCRYEVFTGDHLLNRMLKFCNRLLLTQARVPATASILRENAVLLAEVSDAPVTVHDLARIHLNRLNAHYQPVVDFCRLLLTRATLDFRAGRITQAAFVFDMARLFEEFVAAFLRHHGDELDLAGGRRIRSVEPQHSLGRLFGEFQMQVDLRLKDDTGRTILLDTKYKVLDPDERHQGIAQSDFYQMYAYGRAGTEEYDEIILLYPETGGVQRQFTAGEMRLHVRSFDPRSLWDPATGRIDRAGALKSLRQALSV
jgi:5-methylcytosine-specific restriction enzyme subunit McrC